MLKKIYGLFSHLNTAGVCFAVGSKVGVNCTSSLPLSATAFLSSANLLISKFILSPWIWNAIFFYPIMHIQIYFRTNFCKFPSFICFSSDKILSNPCTPHPCVCFDCWDWTPLLFQSSVLLDQISLKLKKKKRRHLSK